MPVRSSVCTYSPSATSVSNSKYSTVLPTPSSLSVGHYKPLAYSSYGANSTTASKYGAGSTTSGYSSASSGPTSRYSLSSSSYSPSSSSSLTSGSYSSLSSASSSYSPSSTNSGSSGLYRPLHSSAGSNSPVTLSRYASNPPASSRYSSSSASTSSAASSASSCSLSSANSSLLDRTESFLSQHHNSLTSHYKPHTPSPHISRRLSSSVSKKVCALAAPAAAAAVLSCASQTITMPISQNNELISKSGSPSSVGSLASSSSLQSLLSNRSATKRHSEENQLPADVPRGLINLGNTCYMNAVIQSLYSLNSFRKLILRASSHDRTLTSELSDLFKSMNNDAHGAAVSAANFKYTFSRHQAKFSGLGQQDSQEFLRYLINGIHEELNQARKRIRCSTLPKPPKTADEAWRQYRDIVDDSPLVDIVVGQLCSTIVCGQCQNKSYCWDPFWDLSLPLNRSRYSCKLSDVVQDFTAKETLDNDERPICSHCKKATRSTKQIKVCRLPPVMILHLKKFTNDGYKLTSPEVSIDKVLTFNDNTQYNLTACISHHGHSCSSGHYTAHCKYSSSWFHFNDDRIRDVTSSFENLKLNDAYVLFYTQSATGALSQSKL